MDVARKHELDLGEPLFHRFRFRLGPLIISLEVVGKVAVQVETPGVVPVSQSSLYPADLPQMYYQTIFQLWT